MRTFITRTGRLRLLPASAFPPCFLCLCLCLPFARRLARRSALVFLLLGSQEPQPQPGVDQGPPISERRSEGAVCARGGRGPGAAAAGKRQQASNPG